MAKSIFEIDVDDESFKKFKKLFDSYQAALGRMPKQWDKVNEKLDKAAEQLDDMGAKAKKAEGSVRGMTNAVMGLGGALTRAGHSMGALVAHARSLLHTTGLITLGTGLLGGGALWGAANLASSAGGMRRSAQGYGVSIGEMLAFRTNFAKMADPGAVLGNLAAAKNDPSQWWALESMGLHDWRNRSAAQLGPEALLSAKRIFEQGGGNMQYAEARGLTQIVSPEDLRRLQQMTEAEIRAASARYEIDQKEMRVADRTAQAWQNLSIQLERAATTIETAFIRNLSPLAPQLEKLSAAFVKVTNDLFSTEKLGQIITATAEGIEAAGKYLASDKFKEDLKGFGEGVRDVAEAVVRAARWINGWFAERQPGEQGPLERHNPFRRESPEQRFMPEFLQRWLYGDAGGAMIHRSAWRPGGGDSIFPAGWMATGGRVWSDGPAGYGAQGTQAGAGAGFAGGAGNPTVAAAEAASGLPAGLLDRIWAAESGRGRAMGPSRAGALGHFQFMPATGAQYGLRSPADFQDLGRSAAAAGSYMSDLIRQFDGNIPAAVAAYNYGPGNVRRLMRERGGQWQQGLPSETSRYLQNVLYESRFGRAVEIRIDNATGGSAIVTSNVTVVQ